MRNIRDKKSVRIIDKKPRLLFFIDTYRNMKIINYYFFRLISTLLNIQITIFSNHKIIKLIIIIFILLNEIVCKLSLKVGLILINSQKIVSNISM